MAYASSPRPNFDGPALIRYENVTRHLWGDPVAGEVADWIYVSSEDIHQLIFGLPPGGAFRHSDEFRTVFASDEIYYVLSGVMVLANPETGEVHRVNPGEAAFFRRDTWHHAFNHSAEPLRVLEYMAPPPAKGASGAYSRTRPNLTNSKYTQDEWMQRWPMDAAEARRRHTIHVLREADAMLRLEGADPPALVSILAATEHLTVGKIHLLPGQHTPPHRHGGDEGLYLLEGTLNVRIPDNDGQRWFELRPQDGFFVPRGTPHQYYNYSDRPVAAMFGVAPGYLE